MFKHRLTLPLCGALLLALATPRAAQAQQRDAQTRGMIRQAMEDYQNLDIDGALSRLRLALNGCGRNRCTPAMLARVHLSMGIVAIGGQNDSNTGTNEFVEALRLDPNAEPDALLVTPEITTAFATARQRAGAGSGSPAVGIEPPAGGGGGTSRPAAGAVQTLVHTAWSEQLENTPLPVFVERGTVHAARWTVHYRGLGMSGWQHLNLEAIANGYGVAIPCGQVIPPNVEYYVTASDESGAVVAQAGTAESPSRVSVVHTRTQPPPALPGRMPAEQCGEDCPPGMTGPQCRSHGAAGGGGGGSEPARGQRQLGDPCESNNQCGEGMHCDAGSCASGESGGGGGGGPQAPWYRFGFDIGGGIGFGYISGTPTYSEYHDYPAVNPDFEGVPTCGPPRADADPGDPEHAGTLACPGAISTQPLSGGFAPTYFLNFALRFNVTANIGFGAFVRFTPDAATDRPLGNLIIGGRGYYAFTSGGFLRNGFSAAAFVGAGGGQIQVRPPINGMTPGAHVLSGLFNVNAGLRAEYGFANVVHVGAELVLNFELPTFMFVADLHGFVGLHF